MSKVAERMEGAQKLSKGTMPLRIVFDTDAEVAEARKWMKGKRNVKLLHPLTRAESDALDAEAHAAIAKKLGIEMRQ